MTNDVPGPILIGTLPTLGEREIQALADVLIDCVEGGASVSFLSPPSRGKAEAFWRGVGAALLDAAERCALQAGRTLLVLDTVTGADGERLYERQGWQRCGVIPGYALWPDGTACATTVFFKSLRAASPAP